MKVSDLQHWQYQKVNGTKTVKCGCGCNNRVFQEGDIILIGFRNKPIERGGVAWYDPLHQAYFAECLELKNEKISPPANLEEIKHFLTELSYSDREMLKDIYDYMRGPLKCRFGY